MPLHRQGRAKAEAEREKKTREARVVPACLPACRQATRATQATQATQATSLAIAKLKSDSKAAPSLPIAFAPFALAFCSCDQKARAKEKKKREGEGRKAENDVVLLVNVLFIWYNFDCTIQPNPG